MVAIGHGLIAVIRPSRRADNIRGTGLGLSITKAIVDKYQGTIGVESAVGKGSLFVVRIPDADAETEA